MMGTPTLTDFFTDPHSHFIHTPLSPAPPHKQTDRSSNSLEHDSEVAEFQLFITYFNEFTYTHYDCDMYLGFDER